MARVPYAVAARALLRDSLLDAAAELLAERDWGTVTMAEIADAAGVSRQTLYNEFGSRDEFAQAFVLREGDRFLLAVEAAIRAHLDDPQAALSAAFDVFLTSADENPVVRAALRTPDAGMLPQVTTQGQPLVERAAERLAGIVIAGWPVVSESDAALLAEFLVRLAISYAILPAGPAAMTAASVTTLLGPFLERMVSAGVSA
jgi:AcrR family transcriptional regulator